MGVFAKVVLFFLGVSAFSVIAAASPTHVGQTDTTGAERAGVSRSLATGSAEESSTELYDAEMTYENPLTRLPSDCSACVSLYRATRPLMPFVNHVFIGAVVNKTCASGASQEARVYGANKSADPEVWNSYIAEPAASGSRMELLGTTCGAAASQALDVAVQVSVDWQRALSDPIESALRMAATPIMGRPCNNAANEIIDGVKLNH